MGHKWTKLKGNIVHELSLSKNDEETSIMVHYGDIDNATKAETVYKWAEIYQFFKYELYPSIPKEDIDDLGDY